MSSAVVSLLVDILARFWGDGVGTCGPPLWLLGLLELLVCMTSIYLCSGCCAWLERWVGGGVAMI